MNHFDPYLVFRLALAMLFFGLMVYETIALVFWYRSLPNLARKLVILKLLQSRSSALKLELTLIILLTSIEGWLLVELLRWS